MRYIDPDVQEDEVGNNTDLNEPLYMQKLEEVCQNSFDVSIIELIEILIRFNFTDSHARRAFHQY